jgi:hypothetical protein
LTTSSKLSFDGTNVNVKNESNGATTEEQKALTKEATHQALLDVNKELGIKTEEKPKDAKKSPAEAKKEEPKKEQPKPAEAKKEEPKKEEAKPAEVKKEEPKPAEVKKEQPKVDLAQKSTKKVEKKGHAKKHEKKHKKKHHKKRHHESDSESDDEQKAPKKKSKKHAGKNNLLQGGDDIDSDDIFGEQESEDKEIMKSIAYAENKLNAKMGTPNKLPTGKNQPVRYDVEDIAQIKSEHLGNLSNEGQDLGDCDIHDEVCIA